jgi:hypothetical protein
MSYSDIKRRTAEVQDMPAISHACPAYGCPNAAAVSLDAGGKWACYAHASVPFEKWHEITTKIMGEWPNTSNWGHPDRLSYDAENKRIAAMESAA